MIDRDEVLIAGAVLGVAVFAAGAQPSFRLLDEDPALEGFGLSIVAITPDGTGFGGTAQRAAAPGEPANVGFVLTDAGIRLLDWAGAGPDHSILVTALSADASVAVGGASISAGGTSAGTPLRWTADGMAHEVGLPGAGAATYGVATAVSADGSVVVGASDALAFRWTEQAGSIPLGDLRPLPPDRPYSSANGISADGSIVVGMAVADEPLRWSLFRWTSDEGMVDLDPIGTNSLQIWGFGGGANAITGSTIGDRTAFRWTPDEGVVAFDMPGARDSLGLAISDDGSTVVGEIYWATPQPSQSGFLWTAQGGMMDLVEVIETSTNADLTGWHLRPEAISRDGRVVAGLAWLPDSFPGGPRWTSFIFERFSSCPADFNADGRLDFFDFAGFVAAFVAQDAAADLDGDGLFLFADVAALVAGFNAGCP